MAFGTGDSIGADECPNTCCQLVLVAGDVPRHVNVMEDVLQDVAGGDQGARKAPDPVGRAGQGQGELHLPESA